MAIKFNKYFRPTSVEEAIGLLQEYGNDCKILAGGTDLVLKFKINGLKTNAVIDINAIPELKQLNYTNDGIVIGSSIDLRSLSKDEKLKNSEWEIVSKGAGHVSSTQIRNSATLGGNACNASPSADAVPGLMISDAVINVVGPNGKRDINIEDFFVAPGKTVLQPDELVLSFTLPYQGDRCEAAYHKHAIRGDTDISIVCVGVRIQLADDDTVRKVRIALGAVAPTPLRAYEVEQYLEGKKLTSDVIEQAAAMARDLVKPISDQRASKEYRKEMIYVNVKHMIEEAVNKITSKVLVG
ncbi:xanthine dehydrogenase family protein subunit M [Bacillus sp. B15-48]|uniref:FAD binding domain-containing protein n=1 Tax=Bacillus sp. B15-48 TaxID=1548601 RepID=UPI00193FCD0D|nr:xanthine dehydrogenase family protein subunit M [Bacillus sp. B15-48]MBM4761212.1 xanthine dehydrogenase family protein subunit M [Bacillus sp. B15-48]